MSNRPRFTLKAILSCTAALCVALGVAVAVWPFGLVLLSFVTGACVGYLLAGWRGAVIGAMLGIPFGVSIAETL